MVKMSKTCCSILSTQAGKEEKFRQDARIFSVGSSFQLQPHALLTSIDRRWCKAKNQYGFESKSVQPVTLQYQRLAIQELCDRGERDKPTLQDFNLKRWSFFTVHVIMTSAPCRFWLLTARPDPCFPSECISLARSTGSTRGRPFNCAFAHLHSLVKGKWGVSEGILLQGRLCMTQGHQENANQSKTHTSVFGRKLSSNSVSSTLYCSEFMCAYKAGIHYIQIVCAKEPGNRKAELFSFIPCMVLFV